MPTIDGGLPQWVDEYRTAVIREHDGQPSRSVLTGALQCCPSCSEQLINRAEPTPTLHLVKECPACGVRYREDVVLTPEPAEATA